MEFCGFHIRLCLWFAHGHGYKQRVAQSGFGSLPVANYIFQCIDKPAARILTVHQTIRLYARNSKSVLYGLFRKHDDLDDRDDDDDDREPAVPAMVSDDDVDDQHDDDADDIDDMDDDHDDDFDDDQDDDSDDERDDDQDD